MLSRIRASLHAREVRIATERRIRAAQAAGAPVRIVLGSSGIADPGWIPTDRPVLDVAREEDWARLFPPEGIDALLAEHVWEHLSPEDARRGLALGFRHLRPGACFRIAVPDGLHPDPGYIADVRPGGRGPGADTHAVLYDYRSLGRLLTDAGFRLEPVEYFDEDHRFVHNDLDPRRGVVWRSFRFDHRNRDGVARFTSLVLDGVKPDRSV